MPTQTKRVQEIFWVLAVLFLCALPICAVEAVAGNPVAGKRPRVVTVAYFPTAVPVAVLGETLKRDRVLQKALEREGFVVRFMTFANGAQALPLIRQREIDAVMFADMPSIEAAIDGMLIAGTVKRSYASVVAPSGTMLVQLRKKRIGNVFGSTSHYALLQALSSVKLTENDVTIVPLEPTRMAEALAQGRIDAFAAWEPVPTAALKRYPGRFGVVHRQVSLSFFLVSKELAAENPAVADALSAALIRSVRWMKKGRNVVTASGWALDGMRAFTGKPSSLSVEDIAAITREDLLDLPGAPLVSAADKETGSALVREFDFLKRIGRLPLDVSREQFRSSIRDDLLKRLLARRAHHQLNTFDYAP